MAIRLGCIFFLLLTWSCAPTIDKDTTKCATKSLDTIVDVSEELAAQISVDTISTIEPIDFDTTLWTEVTRLDDRLRVDLRYATQNNFVEEQLYDCPRCFLRPEAAAAFTKVHRALNADGYYLKLFDCYRPKSVQEKLWAKVPNATYVTPPQKGSMHNRGYAVDVTLLDADFNELDMGSEFDFFGRQAHHDYYDLEPEVLQRRELLRETMLAYGFKHIRTEWWHYSYQGPYKSPFQVADFQWSCH